MYACVRVLIEVNVAPEGCAANLRPNRSNSIRTSPRKWMKHGGQRNVRLFENLGSIRDKGQYCFEAHFLYIPLSTNYR